MTNSASQVEDHAAISSSADNLLAMIHHGITQAEEAIPESPRLIDSYHKVAYAYWIRRKQLREKAKSIDTQNINDDALNLWAKAHSIDASYTRLSTLTREKIRSPKFNSQHLSRSVSPSNAEPETPVSAARTLNDEILYEALPVSTALDAAAGNKAENNDVIQQKASVAAQKNEELIQEFERKIALDGQTHDQLLNSHIPIYLREDLEKAIVLLKQSSINKNQKNNLVQKISVAYKKGGEDFPSHAAKIDQYALKFQIENQDDLVLAGDLFNIIFYKKNKYALAEKIKAADRSFKIPEKKLVQSLEKYLENNKDLASEPGFTQKVYACSADLHAIRLNFIQRPMRAFSRDFHHYQGGKVNLIVRDLSGISAVIYAAQFIWDFAVAFRSAYYLSEEERELNFSRRLWNNLTKDERQDRMLNDGPWAIINSIGFFADTIAPHLAAIAPGLNLAGYLWDCVHDTRKLIRDISNINQHIKEIDLELAVLAQSNKEEKSVDNDTQQRKHLLESTKTSLLTERSEIWQRRGIGLLISVGLAVGIALMTFMSVSSFGLTAVFAIGFISFCIRFGKRYLESQNGENQKATAQKAPPCADFFSDSCLFWPKQKTQTQISKGAPVAIRPGPASAN